MHITHRGRLPPFRPRPELFPDLPWPPQPLAVPIQHRFIQSASYRKPRFLLLRLRHFLYSFLRSLGGGIDLSIILRRPSIILFIAPYIKLHTDIHYTINVSIGATSPKPGTEHEHS